MKKDVIEICYELSDQIRKSDVFLSLKKIEKNIEDNQVLQKLEKAFIIAQEHLIAVDEKGSEEEKSEARRLLSSAKYQLDIHPLVMAYNRQLKALNQIYDEVNQKVFHKFRTHRSCKI